MTNIFINIQPGMLNHKIVIEDNGTQKILTQPLDQIVPFLQQTNANNIYLIGNENFVRKLQKQIETNTKFTNTQIIINGGV